MRNLGGPQRTVMLTGELDPNLLWLLLSLLDFHPFTPGHTFLLRKVIEIELQHTDWGKNETKLSLFAGDIILQVENPKDSTKKND